MSSSTNTINYVLVALQLFFMFTSATVERAYCLAPLDPNDATPLVKQTIEFCQQYNQLFLARPRWLIEATCIHAYWSWMLYSTILVTATLDKWYLRSIQTVILLGIGMKLYAIVFYHYMEFTSDMPPPNPLAYFSAEGAYIVSIVLVLYKITTSTGGDSGVTTKTKKQQ